MAEQFSLIFNGLFVLLYRKMVLIFLLKNIILVCCQYLSIIIMNFMSTITELQEQLVAIQRQIDEQRALGKKQAIGEIKAKMAEFDITVDELESKGSSRGFREKKPSVIKYRKSDAETWVGRGPKPVWVKDVEAAGGKISDYLVQ
jgi:DNA-binding protein H-NS